MSVRAQLPDIEHWKAQVKCQAGCPVKTDAGRYVQLVAEGQTTKEIAHRLNVSIKTIETHRQRLMDRLDIHDVPGLVRFAIRAGIVSLDK